MNKFKYRIFSIPVMIYLVSLLFVSCSTVEEQQWRALFNGENLDGWDIKISGFELNDNFNNTFRVENGNLLVSYDQYDEFDGSYGHIFFNEPFSYYKVRAEYRFTGDQAKGGAGWAFRNNGIMFHSQSAESMDLDQDFPNSIEAQLLGGSGSGDRPNFSVCTPGTDVVIDDTLRTQHCITSNGKTYHGDQWVTVELHVYADSIVHHIIENDTVLT